jgi:hypothetical protein
MAAVVLGIGMVGGACTRNDNNKTASNDRDVAATASPSPYGTVADNRDTTTATGNRVNEPDAGDIASNPAKYDGQHVTLKADVKTLMPNGFFQLDDHDMLVLSPSGQPGEKEKVTVSGTVQTYSAPEFKKKYGWFKSSPEVDAKYKNRAVIVADSIMTADGREVVASGGSALPAGSGELHSNPKRPTTGGPASRP